MGQPERLLLSPVSGVLTHLPSSPLHPQPSALYTMNVCGRENNCSVKIEKTPPSSFCQAFAFLEEVPISFKAQSEKLLEKLKYLLKKRSGGGGEDPFPFFLIKGSGPREEQSASSLSSLKAQGRAKVTGPVLPRNKMTQRGR